MYNICIESEESKMNKPHKHAELIKAWAGGAEIQMLDILTGKWVDIPNPAWYTDKEYRIKPKVGE